MVSMGMDNRNQKKIITEGLGLIEDSLIIPLAKKIANTKISRLIHPNFIALIKIILILIFPILLFKIDPLFLKIGSISLLFYFFALLDRLDGGFARIQNKSSKFGELLDGLTDKFFEIFVLVVLGYYFNLILWSLFLVSFISFINYSGERFKLVYHIKQRQENIFDYLNFKNPLKFFTFILLCLTRNDVRKLIVILAIFLNSPYFVFVYFEFVYFIYLINILRQIFNLK